MTDLWSVMTIPPNQSDKMIPFYRDKARAEILKHLEEKCLNVSENQEPVGDEVQTVIRMTGVAMRKPNSTAGHRGGRDRAL